jgi:hypothetical protein
VINKTDDDYPYKALFVYIELYPESFRLIKVYIKGLFVCVGLVGRNDS